MAKKDEKETSTNEGIKAEDAIFMAECLKHLQTPANIDVKGVAAALNYKNSASVGNRIRVLKKKFDLKVGTTAGTAAAGADGAPGPATISPRKGAAAHRGPAKATAASNETSETESKAGSGAGAKKARTPRKRAAKSTAKVEDSDDEEDVAVKSEEEA